MARGKAVAAAVAGILALAACQQASSKKRTKKARPGASASTPRPGLRLKRKKGVPFEIAELTARPSLSVLSGVADVRFPGETEVGANTFEIRFSVRARSPIAEGGVLVVRNACRFGEHVLTSEREVEVRLADGDERVRLFELKEGKRAIGSSTSLPAAPQLGKASACELTFFYQRGDERKELGRVCATGGTRIKRKACSGEELARPGAVGDRSVNVTEPVGRVADAGTAGWYLVTANRVLDAQQRPWTRVTCLEGAQRASRVFAHHDLALGALEPGESMTVAFGMAELKWLTREKGRCEIAIGVGALGDAAQPASDASSLATYCIRGGRTSAGKCGG